MDLYSEVWRIIAVYSASEGCSTQAAMRDLLTDIRHIAQDLDLDFDAAVVGSEEVASEEHRNRS